jgi:hypothetical protein
MSFQAAGTDRLDGAFECRTMLLGNPHMTRPCEYQFYAKECARWVAQAKSKDERIALLEMARARPFGYC